MDITIKFNLSTKYPCNEDISFKVKKITRGVYGNKYYVFKLTNRKCYDCSDFWNSYRMIQHKCNHLVKIYGVGRLSDEFEEYMKSTCVVMMEKLRKESKRKRINIDKLVDQIFKAELYIEENYKMAHIDIKYDNVLVDKSGNYCLTDYGLMEKITDRFIPDNYVLVYDNYFVWPNEELDMNQLSCYSIAIMIMNILIKDFDYGLQDYSEYLTQLESPYRELCVELMDGRLTTEEGYKLFKSIITI